MTLKAAICFVCINYESDRKCPAFPQGIPDSIWYGESLHENVIDGQVGSYILKRE